ncbi:Adenylate kinase [Mucinivorans hirudinis]|uniref:Adenylate kinase n=1 Tax=Mucinivorans hirudinis TaxID=1433126 RepID=A0A060RCI4_9BACT|nr:Adenylate kinase [Mucinivorans hirudinis]
MINIVLFGAPGSGKGTQADKLKEKYNLIHLSTGEVIRNEIRSGSALGTLAAKQMADGALASDDLVCGIINKFISSVADDTMGVIYDGFPRTMNQANEFDRMLKFKEQSVSMMIAIEITDEEVVKRISERGKISGRADDQSEEVIHNRIAVYKAQTAVVAEHYAAQNKYFGVDGMGTIEEVFERICAVIDKNR